MSQKTPPRDPASTARAEPAPLHCHTCREVIAVYDGINYGSIETGYRQLCSRCFNEEIARAGGLHFQHVQFEPVEMHDAGGERHEFHCRVRLIGDRVALEAFELKSGEPDGYEFEMIGEAEDDLFALLARLIERMRRALAVIDGREVSWGQLGLAWYTRETWAHLREVADDAQALDGSFEEWERRTLAAIRDLESVGLADVLGWLAACMTHEEILSDYI